MYVLQIWKIVLKISSIPHDNNRFAYNSNFNYFFFIIIGYCMLAFSLAFVGQNEIKQKPCLCASTGHADTLSLWNMPVPSVKKKMTAGYSGCSDSLLLWVLLNLDLINYRNHRSYKSQWLFCGENNNNVVKVTWITIWTCGDVGTAKSITYWH